MTNRLQFRLALGILCVGLFILTFVATVLINPSIYRSEGALGILGLVAKVAALIASIGLFGTALIISMPIAVRPVTRLQKIFLILPVFMLAVLLLAVTGSVLKIGTIGSFVTVKSVPFTLTGAAIIICAVLSLILIVVLILRVKLSSTSVKAALITLSVTLAPILVVAAVLVASVVIISTSRPAEGADDSLPPGQVAMQGMEGMSGAPSAAPIGTPRSYVVAGVLAAVFAGLALITTISGDRGLRSLLPATNVAVTPLAYKYEIGSALTAIVAVSLVILVIIQFVPVNRTNPPVQSSVKWDSPQTEQLWDRACADCHSNSTKWPWYSYIAPSSWFLSIHVQGGRQHFNISYLDSIPRNVAAQFPPQAGDQMKIGAMPPSDYLILHPEARLTDAEKQALIQGLQKTFSQ